MTDNRTTATGSVWLDRLTLPYWIVAEWWQLLRFDRCIGIGGPWWTRRRQRRAFWDDFADQWHIGGVS